MEFTKKESYALQIGLYLKSGQGKEACSLAQQMVMRFQKEPLSHFMAAKAFFLSGSYKKAEIEGLRAYNLSQSRQDLVSSAIVAASAMLMLNEYEKGQKLLLPFGKERNPELKKLLLVFSMVGERGHDAARYYAELDGINRSAARKFMLKLARYMGKKE